MRYIFLLLPFLLGGCPKGMSPLGIDKEKIFAELPGPEVEGVEKTLLVSARMATQRGEHDKAVQLYRQLVEMDESNDAYGLALAESLRRANELDKSEIIYKRLLKRSPELIDAQEGLGLLKLTRGEFDKAGLLLSEVQEAEPMRWRTLNGLAILFIERGQIDEALAYFKEAEAQAPDNISILNNVGLTHAINDNPDKAIAALSKAIDTAQHGSIAKRAVELNLAMVLGIYGDSEVAEKILTQHLPPAAVSNNLGLYAYLSQDDVLAKSYLNMALSKSAYHYERAWKNLDAITESSSGDKKARKKGKRIKVE